jgi:catechol 2,3-dioxygenase-like lactoylglutathione lyase family enzyme
MAGHETPRIGRRDFWRAGAVLGLMFPALARGAGSAMTKETPMSKPEPRPTSQAPVVIDRFDHVVLTVADVERTCTFYSRALGMEVQTFGAGRKALVFGRQKINLHQQGKEIDPKARRPTPGSADLCLIAATPVDAVLAHLQAIGITIEEGGIVPRTGAAGPIRSVYFRDPDENLIEVSNYVG